MLSVSLSSFPSPISLPPRDAAEEPETLEVLRVQMSESARAALESACVGLNPIP